MLGGLLSGITNPISSGLSGLFGADTFNPFKKMKKPHPDDPKYNAGGGWDGSLYNKDKTEWEINEAEMSQFQEAAMELGKEEEYKTPSMLRKGMSRPAMQKIVESPEGAPLNISLPGGNVPPGPSTPGTFGSMQSLMQRADLLNQLKKKRIF